MSKSGSQHKPNMAAKRKRALYKLEQRAQKNKKRKALKELAKAVKLARKGKGIYAKDLALAAKHGVTVTLNGEANVNKPSTAE